ncbi:AMP-binding protein [Pseudophaeobacter leonis]|uniref:AMP-binding protein n=1 Tax=Pseudophaeobacter leonis TaxID=1144477 RepID=UPI0009F68EC3|nr:AMP-binding protein [Pseudophaeobacter leonis]
MEHTQNVAADSGAQLVISTHEMQDWLCEALPGKTVLAIEDFPTAPEEIREGIWQDPGLDGAEIAHLQYTSGSTSAPKGVAISHKNIAHNASDVCSSFHISADSRLLCWLPHYHDLGLVFGCIVPVYAGSLSLLMPPTHFAQRPVRWLQAMQNHSVTHSAAPNFAYDACLALPPAATAGLDLSAVKALLNGAEPVRAETVQRFATRFAQNGLGADVQCPAYGMAENTLVLSVNGPDCPLKWDSFDSDALQQRRLVPATDATVRHRGLVACNGSPLGSEIRIVNPDTRDLSAAGEIGEIWAQGPSVAAGYWQRKALSQQKFHAQINGAPGDWLRTGDLGGMSGADLFVIGRLDDVMVLRGINYSPEDTELTVEACDPALEQSGAIVFASEIGTAMRLVVVHEVTRSALRILRRKGTEAEAEAAALQQHLVNTIRARVAEQHDLELGALVLLPPKGLPKTHTGKKKRHACRTDFAAGTFTGVATWISPRYAPVQEQVLSPDKRPVQATTVITPGTSPVTTTAATAAAPPATRGPAVTSPADLPDDTSHAQPEKTADLIGWLREYGETRLNSRLMDERRTIPPHVVMDFGNQGLLGMVAPKHYGGLGLRNSEILNVVEHLAAIDTTLASFTVVNNALGLRPILRHAQPELIDRLMPRLATGRELASFAMTEAGAGSNIRNLSATGRSDGTGSWHLHGTKLWSGTAAWADVINTFVRLENPAGGGQAVSGFVLEAGAAGLRQGPEALTLGLRAMGQNQVILEGVKVTADQRLGEIGQGMAAATDPMEYGRFAIAAMSLGVIKRCLQLMLRHGGRRTIAPGRLLDNPATNLRISELAAASGAIEALIRTVAAQLDAELPPPPELYCACKSLAPEYAWYAADGLIQQMAGRGYIETNIAPQILRDARVLRIFEGPTEPMNAHIGARLVQFPEDLQHYVGTRLEQPALATEMGEMAQQIWQHHMEQPALWGGHAAAKAQAHLTIGEAAAHGLMLACLTHHFTTVPDFLPAAAAKRAQDWARLRFEHSRAKALTPSAALTARLDRVAMEALRDSCAAAIGDVEQQMAGCR